MDISLFSLIYGWVIYFFNVKKEGLSIVKKSSIHKVFLIVFSLYEIKIFNSSYFGNWKS